MSALSRLYIGSTSTLYRLYIGYISVSRRHCRRHATHPGALRNRLGRTFPTTRGTCLYTCLYTCLSTRLHSRLCCPSTHMSLIVVVALEQRVCVDMCHQKCRKTQVPAETVSSITATMLFFTDHTVHTNAWACVCVYSCVWKMYRHMRVEMYIGMCIDMCTSSASGLRNVAPAKGKKGSIPDVPHSCLHSCLYPCLH